MTKFQQEIHVLLLTNDRPSIQNKVTISGDKGSTGNKDSIGEKRPPINTEQDTISCDKGPVGNKGSIGAKGPFIYTEQGEISGDTGLE